MEQLRNASRTVRLAAGLVVVGLVLIAVAFTGTAMTDHWQVPLALLGIAGLSALGVGLGALFQKTQVALVDVRTRLARTDEAVRRNHTSVRTTQDHVSGVVRELTDLEVRANDFRAELQALDVRAKDVREELQALDVRANDAREELQALDVRANDAREDLQALDDRMSRLEAASESALSEIKSQDQRVRHLDELVVENRLPEIVGAIAGSRLQPARRYVSPDEAKALIDIAETQLGFGLTQRHIRYIERLIIGAELGGIGRIAAHTPDIVLRVVATLSREAPIRHVEIGVLSGLYSAFLGRAAMALGVEIEQILIDPLDSYYDESVLDKLTLSTISPENVEANMKALGVPGDRYHIVQRRSVDALEHPLVRGGAFGTILIDGDHSARGVSDDISGYRSLLAPGGLLIFDDYGNEAWPGVAAAVDDAVEAGAIELVAHCSETALAVLTESTGA